MDRVLEIGGVAAGYCGRLFVYAGAEVVRINRDEPEPAWASTRALDLYLHRGKRRLATADTGLLSELAAQADIVVCEAPTADSLQALGFDNWSALVKVALTPFGRTGPKRNWQATPNVLLAMGGYTQLMGDPDRAPLSLPGHYLEFQTGALGYMGACACRLQDVQQSLDISMLETLMSLSQFTTVRWHCAHEIRSRHGSDFHFVVPSDLFACADGWVYINIVPAFWDALTVFLERPELLLEPRFSDNDRRMQNRAALHEIVAAAVAGASRAELADRAERCRIPLGVVMSLDEVLTDPHLAARGCWEDVAVPGGGVIHSPRVPFRIDTAPVPRRSRAGQA